FPPLIQLALIVHRRLVSSLPQLIASRVRTMLNARRTARLLAQGCLDYLLPSVRRDSLTTS
ncbi:MAG: hypothetical protein ACXWN0_10725, partial [Isosphaeraceae bacterium]